ncbi:MAG: tetratricopeptide repeat protein, partial [Acidobacteriota bacterium]
MRGIRIHRLIPVLFLTLGSCGGGDSGSALQAILKNASERLAAGDPASALPPLQDAIQKHPENIPLRFLLADAYIGIGNLDLALQHLREVNRQDPQAPTLHRRIGSLLARQGNFEQAVREMEIEIATHPGDWLSLYNLGSFYINARMPELAIPRLEAA